MNSTRAALYLRSSADRSDVSIDAQRRELTALASSKSLIIAAEFLTPSNPRTTRPALVFATF